MILWQDNKYIFKRTKQYTLFKDDDIKRLQIQPSSIIKQTKHKK